MGEQRPNADAKVFEVKIAVEGADTTLRPGMTTGNAVETYRTENVLSISLEALGSEEGVPFVYRQSGGRTVRQEVVTGAMSDEAVIITDGLKEGDRVLLVPPRENDKMELVRLPDSKVRPQTAGGDTAPTYPLPSPDSSAKADAGRDSTPPATRKG
jgi:hypothetical protein